MTKIKVLLAAVALTASATAASAVPVTIDFSQTQSGDVPTLTFTGGGYTVTATAKHTDGARNVLGSSLVNSTSLHGSNQGGLGVRSPDDTNHAIDGSIDIKDLLLLTFNKPVKLISVSFGLVDNKFGGDKAYVTVDGSFLGNSLITNADWPDFKAYGAIGTQFGIGALGKTDEFKVRAIQVSPVPVPPALILLASGLVGMGALARRRKNT